MDLQASSSTSATPNRNASNDDAADPLVEQMSTILRLSSRPTLAAQQAQRPRRFSDPDQAVAGPSSEPIAVRSRDGSRWLPAPAERSHRYGSGTNSTAVEDEPVPKAVASQPPEPHKCEAAVCAVAKVSATTELLELIVGMLNTRDVLNLRRTNKQWNETVKLSPELRLHLFYYPQFARPAAEFQLLPLSLPCLSIELGEPLHLGQWIEVSMTAEAAKKIAPEPKGRRVRSRSIFEGLRGGLGARNGESSSDVWPQQKSQPPEQPAGPKHEDLFITQPPILGMQAFISASQDIDDEAQTEPVVVAKLSCDAGITLGFLAETAQSLLATEKSGGDARVLFKAIVSFTNNTDAAPRRRGGARTVTRIR